MEHQFYAPPENFKDHESVEIMGPEANHISRVLRHDIGDTIQVSDGMGNVFDCKISGITKKSVLAHIEKTTHFDEPVVKKMLVFGAIKKRDRLEFAIEKAVELDAWEICVFHADHSERSKVNQERLQSIALSAFKQSKRHRMPRIIYLDSLDEVLNHYQDYRPVLAHVESTVNKPTVLSEKNILLIVGPEGGFSEREIELAKNNKAQFISLGKHRLRAETAVTAILSQYLFTE